MTAAMNQVYTLLVAGGYSAIGIGLPVESVAQSRIRKSTAFSFSVPFMAVRSRSRKARQLPLRGFTGSPTRLTAARLGLLVAVVTQLNPWSYP